MVNVNGRDITLTRGDTMRLQVTMTLNGDPYTPVDGDTLRAAVKHPWLNPSQSDYVEREPLIIKQIPTSTLLWELQPEDTKTLGFGPYDYDIQLTFADGTVDTFLTGRLVLTPEVD